MRGIVTLILCLFVTPIRAQTPIDIGDGMPLLSLAAISETHAGSPLDSIDSVSQQDDWKGPGEEFRFGLRGEPVWIHFRVRNPSADPATAFVSIPAPWISHAQLFRSTEGAWVKTETGYAVPHAQWDVRSFYPSLRILLGSRENADLYLRIESNRVLNFPASIMDRSEFRQRDRARTTISGLMIGVFLALLSLACILLFVERNSAFTLYCLYLLFLAAGLAAMMGNGIQFFASVEPQILSRIGIMAFPAARAILLLMIPFFCGRPIAGNQIIIRIAGIEMICGLVLAAGGWTISAQISTAIAFLSTILEIGALAASLRAAATLPAWLWLIAAGARIPAYVFEFGYLPYSTAVVYFWIFLIPLDFLILADRIRMLRTEKSRYAKSRITGLDVSSIVTKMEKILTIDQLLRDPTLRLPDLARALDIPAYQLSEILNNVVQKSFREYINGLRIQTAQRSFTVDPDADIDTVMRENGFRSRSVFNHAFKSQTGQTPVEFKRSSQK